MFDWFISIEEIWMTLKIPLFIDLLIYSTINTFFEWQYFHKVSWSSLTLKTSINGSSHHIFHVRLRLKSKDGALLFWQDSLKWMLSHVRVMWVKSQVSVTVATTFKTSSNQHDVREGFLNRSLWRDPLVFHTLPALTFSVCYQIIAVLNTSGCC